MKEMCEMALNLPKIECNTSYEYDGVKVPRVTSIISTCIHSDSLMYWANNLGFKHQSYKKTLDYSASVGTECHSNIENFISGLSNEEQISFDYQQANFAYESFRRWWDDINKNNIVRVLMHEQPLVCRYFGGTLDGLYEINGKKYLVDYKTSNTVTYKYCLQLAAYKYMLAKIGIEINGAIILQLSKNDISYKEYFMDFSYEVYNTFIDQCEKTFLNLVQSYYYITKVETDFNKFKF